MLKISELDTYRILLNTVPLSESAKLKITTYNGSIPTYSVKFNDALKDKPLFINPFVSITPFHIYYEVKRRLFIISNYLKLYPNHHHHLNFQLNNSDYIVSLQSVLLLFPITIF